MGWKPTDINGCKLWLDASQITGLSDGAELSTWQDASGNSNNATYVAAKPIYKTNQIDTIDPAVQFGGGVTAGTFTPMTFSAAITPANGFTFFAVAKAPASSGRGMLLSNNKSSNARWAMGKGESTNEGWGWGGTNGAIGLGTMSAAFASAWNIQAWTKDSAEWKTYNNKTLVATIADTTAMSGSTWSGIVGAEESGNAVYAFHGLIAELIMFNAVLSQSDRELVSDYLNWKYFGGADTGGFGDIVRLAQVF